MGYKSEKESYALILKNEMTQIIYISGIESYAMQLFQNRPMDFLVKASEAGTG